MTIGKAIELLNNYVKSWEILGPTDLREAEKMGLRALKRIKKARQGYTQIILRPLQDETEE